MIKRLSNPTYSYISGGAVTVSCTLEVLADDGTTVIATTSLSYIADLNRPDFRQLVAAELARQANEYIDQLLVVAGLVAAQFGTTDFDAAMVQLMADTTALIGG